MSIGRDGTDLRQLSTLFNLGTVGGLTDGQLLERFATGSREAAEGAFAALIQRHGPMVLQTCRGVLSDRLDAEDAFQATFLVLVRKARRLWVQDSLGPWLHQVAYRTASAARSASIRRRGHERRMAASAIVTVSPASEGAGTVGEWERRVLHEEIARLPERYRVPMVLCGLEGLTQEQAAQRLRWPVGTVKSRLARGRERLRARLTRRGLARSAGVPAAIFRIEAGRAGVPAALAGATIRIATRCAAGKMAAGVVSASVAALTDGVLRTMALTKMTTLGVSGLLLGAVLAGAGVLAQPAEGLPPDRNATQHKLVRYQLRRIEDHKKVGPLEQKVTVYADLAAPRLRFESKAITLNNVLENNSVMVQDNQKDRFLKLISYELLVDENRADANQAKVIKELKERGRAKKRAYLYRLTRQDGQPFNLDDLVKGRPLLDSLRELQDHPDTVSTPTQLDGRRAMKYRLQEEDRTTSLWVDPMTNLPLRIECKISHPAPEVSRSSWIYTEFEWDPKGLNPAQLFSTEPPPGYAVEDHTNDPVVPSSIARGNKADGPESAAVLKGLEEKVSMRFANATPLEVVLKYIRVATRGPNDAGIGFTFDEEGLKRAGQTCSSLVTLDVEDQPLKTSLKELLRPLGLAYEVKKGVLTITSEPTKDRRQP